MTKSIHAICGALLAMTYATVSSAQPRDIELIPPANGGVSVKRGNTNEQLFRINEAGEVFIKNLPNELSGTPLCWNAATGRLGKCASGGGSGGSGGDITPPTIEADVPEVATSKYVNFTVKYSDDIELGYSVYTFGVGTRFFDPGVKTEEVQESIEIYLGAEPRSKILIAVDSSGNMTKLPISISAPQTSFVLGDYDVVSGETLPDGFNCSPYYSDLDGSTLDSATLEEGSSILLGSGWSVSAGYGVSLRIKGTGPSSVHISAASEGKIPLEATSASLRGMIQIGSGGNFYYIGNIEARSSDPSIVDVTIQMECEIDNVKTFGEEAVLTLRAK